jgi:hypothetical protein
MLDKGGKTAIRNLWGCRPPAEGDRLGVPRADRPEIPRGEDGMDFEKDAFEDDNELSRMEDEEEGPGGAGELIETEEEEVLMTEEPVAVPPASKPARKKKAKKKAKKAAKKSKPKKKGKAKGKKKAKKKGRKKSKKRGGKKSAKKRKKR